MKKIYAALSMLMIALLFMQCQRDLSYVGAPDTGSPLVLTPDPIKSALQGNVVDENGQPSPNVSVTVGSQKTITNASGYFRINDASLDKNTSLVIAEKTGYFKAYRVFGATSGANQVTIKLVRKSLVATIQGSAGGTATLNNGAKVSLPAGGVVDAASNSAYNGDVRIYAAYIDPTSGDIGQSVPGSFMANDKDGGRVVLTSYGMLAVELESTAGAKLQIKTGSTATLTTPIPASLLASATASIPLWYVNETSGLWTEEGSATKQGNAFVGDVKHFTYWNCDYPNKAVNITLTLKTAAGQPLVHANVKFKPEGGGGIAHGYSDSLGQIKGLVPANKPLVLEVSDACGGIAYSQNIPALSTTTNLGTVTVSGGTASIVTFQGKINDCNGIAAKDGYAMINFNNSVRYAKANSAGEYSVTFVSCSGVTGNAQVIVVDNAAQQQGAAASVAVAVPVTNAGILTACGTSSSQFIKYNLNGTEYNISSNTSDSLYAFTNNAGALTIFGSQSLGTANHISLVVRNVTAAGTYPVGEMALRNYRQVILKTPFNIVFTNFAGAAGQFHEGTFSGTFTADSSATVNTISGSFKIRRI